MPSIETLMTVTLAGLALSLSPGPSMLYVLSRSIGQNVKAGIASALGLALGGVLLAILTAFGLTVILKSTPVLYRIIQVLGACYLVYLGVQMISASWKTETHDTPLENVKRQGYAHIIVQGVLVELLNPKTILFFLAFIPQFVKTENGSTILQMLILGMLVPLTAIPSDIFVSLTGGSVAYRIKKSKIMKHALEWLSGLFLIGIGLNIFFSGSW